MKRSLFWASRLCVILAVICFMTFTSTSYAVKRQPPLSDLDGQGRTLLSIAVFKGQLARVKSLIAKGADVNAKNSDGWSPYMLPRLKKIWKSRSF